MPPLKTMKRHSTVLIFSLILAACATQPEHEAEKRYKDVSKETTAGKVSFVHKTESADGKRPEDHSMLPRIVVDKRGEQVVIPAHLQDGEVVGELAMGQSTLNEALKILPSYPWEPPQRPRGQIPTWMPGQIREILEENKYSYNPAGSLLVLGFNH